MKFNLQQFLPNENFKNSPFPFDFKKILVPPNQEGKSAIYVSQMYSKSLTERRNAALNDRADLKELDPSIQGYVKFPATLMIKRTGERKYSLEKEF